MENWRIGHLKQAGYHFEQSWLTEKNQSLDRFLIHTSRKFGKDRVFFQGVIFTNYTDKGTSLQAFLQYTHIKPKKIISIDDHKENIESVEATAKQNGIDFVGIEYTAAKDKKITPLDQDRARLQLSILDKEQQWLSDEEADKRIKIKN
jgi:hypothetical protein